MSGKQFYDCHDWVQQPDGTYVCKTCGVSDLENPLPPCQLPLLGDDLIVFEPINIEAQIEEAILGESDETKSLILKKKTYLQSRLSALLRVNGKKVSDPSVQGDDVFYWLDKSGIVYYYPIKYARLEFIGGNDEHKDSDPDA